VIDRLISSLARLSLVGAVVLTTGGCCRCWWPGSLTTRSDTTVSTKGTAAGAKEGEGEGEGVAVPSAPGRALTAQLSRLAFVPDPRVPLHGAIMIASRGLDDAFFFDELEGKQMRFVPHSATSVAAMFNGDVVVEANTGIWSHDPVTLARGARLVAPPFFAMAASPDGHYLAYASGVEVGSVADLQVISYPDGKHVASFHGVDRPWRLRFSPDSKRLVVGSRAEETVTLIDIASKSLRRYDTDDDVNDAIALPGEGDLVAYANDGDVAVIHAMATNREVFSTAPFMRAAQGVSLAPITGSPRHILTMTRDQNAVAFDPLGGVFFAGGDDNLVWRFHGATGPSPKMDPPVELNGNIEEILCTHNPAPGQTEASAVVALDTLAIHVLTPDGKVQSSFGPLNWSVLSTPIRIALTQEDEVLTVLDGALARFKPSDASVTPSHEYTRRRFDWPFSFTEQDTVIAAGGDPITLHRVVHAAATADTATTIVGTVNMPGAGIEAFTSGTRLLFGPSPKGRLELVYYVPSSGTVEPPLDIDGAASLARVARRKDGAGIGLLDTEGNLFEATEAPRGAKLVGRVRGELRPSERLEWDILADTWKVTDLPGHVRPIEPP
jgi:WD40 repeat protein